MKLKYKGTDERVFPSLGITVKPGDEFDAPEGFSHPDCEAAGYSKPAATPAPTPTTTLSAASDPIAKEVK
jgi:hypothetical protein